MTRRSQAPQRIREYRAPWFLTEATQPFWAGMFRFGFAAGPWLNLYKQHRSPLTSARFNMEEFHARKDNRDAA